MNFCVAILLLKMEENTQHFLVYYALLFQERLKHNWDAQKDLCRVWRKFCEWSSVSKVVCKVSAGDFVLDDAPQSSRAVKVDSDQIEALIENNQCYNTWEIANLLKIF